MNKGKELVVDKYKIYKQWNIQVDGLFMYFEYTFQDAVKFAYELEHYGSWELVFEDWKNPAWIDYMKDYFIPTHEPKRHAVQQLNK